MDISLLNDLGQVIYVARLDEHNSLEISVADLPSGIYFVTGQNDQELIKQKVIVTK